jgi:hypothetical protein
MPKRQVEKRPPDHPLVEFLFAAGAILVIVGLFYAVRRSWPSLDPLSLVMLVGIGLLLVVACERLRLILQELQELTSLLRTAPADVSEETSK